MEPRRIEHKLGRLRTIISLKKLKILEKIGKTKLLLWKSFT